MPACLAYAQAPHPGASLTTTYQDEHRLVSASLAQQMTAMTSAETYRDLSMHLACQDGIVNGAKVASASRYKHS